MCNSKNCIIGLYYYTNIPCTFLHSDTFLLVSFVAYPLMHMNFYNNVQHELVFWRSIKLTNWCRSLHRLPVKSPDSPFHHVMCSCLFQHTLSASIFSVFAITTVPAVIARRSASEPSFRSLVRILLFLSSLLTQTPLPPH